MFSSRVAWRFIMPDIVANKDNNNNNNNYYYYYTIWISLVTGLFFLALLLNQR